MKKSPKVVIIGSGSLFFGRKAIWQMVHSEHLREGELALVDTDTARLQKMHTLAQRVIANNQSPLTLTASTDRREVLRDADFVVLSFAHENARYRGVDCEISERYGIRMCSGDTIGPGGVFRSLRELPEVMDVAEDIQQLAPEAWLINYINPTTVHGMALKRYFPNLKSFAICDAQYNLKRSYAHRAGIIEDEADYDAQIERDFQFYTAGPNHFSWVLKAEYQGKDVTEQLVARSRDLAEREAKDPAYQGAKGLHNAQIQVQLYDCFGSLPTVLGHTKEYLRFWQGHGLTEEAYGQLKIFEHEDRIGWTNQVWERVDAYNSGQVSMDEFDKEFGPDPATGIIENMWAGLKNPVYINTFNQGAITNMADDAYLELYCDIDMEGPKPLPVGPMPRGIRGLMEQILDTHELTAEAIVKQDMKLLRRALLTDPLTNSISDTEALMRDLFAAERGAIREEWYDASLAKLEAPAPLQ